VCVREHQIRELDCVRDGAIRVGNLNAPAKRERAAVLEFLRHKIARALPGFEARTLQGREFLSVWIGQALEIRNDMKEEALHEGRYRTKAAIRQSEGGYATVRQPRYSWPLHHVRMTRSQKRRTRDWRPNLAQ
jgi:hypothetical protein